MDLYNNWYAAQIGEWARSHGRDYGWALARIEKAVMDGELVTHMNKDFYVRRGSENCID
ncbi:MAG: hypothetical protein JST89_14325 [Cyanobacteria bacterium SZAS-4]|nr:hypothetical protein [Cyanobacteria bacterium SZAS-4]